MYWFSRCFGVLAITLLVLPSWGQDEKKDKDKDKDEKKVKKSVFAEKDKKAFAKDKEEKLSYGQVLTGRIKTIDANSQKDFTIELQLPDPMKIYDFQFWNVQQKQSLAQHQVGIAQAGDVVTRNQRVAAYQAALAQYNVAAAQRQNNLTSAKDFDVRAGNDIKVRSSYPPQEYDDKGNMKRWTAKELLALKKGSKLPGYPAEYDILKPGQLVAVYLAKAIPAAGKGKAKGLKIEDPVDAINTRPEVVMLVVMQDAAPQR